MIAIKTIADTKLSTLCLVPTRVLLEQWQSELSKYLEEPIGVYGDGTHNLASVTVATFESAYRHMRALGNRFGLLIIDEVHHFGNGMRDEALELCTASHRLGLTATYVTKDESKKRLQDLVGPTVYALSISQLQGDYLSPFDLLTLQVDLSLPERRAYDVAIAKFREYYNEVLQACPDSAWVDFMRLAVKSPEGRAALSAWHTARKIISFPRAKLEVLSSLLDRHRERKTLIFTASTDTAYKIARRFLIMPITADIKRSERDDVLSGFREGRLKTIVSCRVLNEGVDVPDIQVAIIVGGTLGERGTHSTDWPVSSTKRR